MPLTPADNSRIAGWNCLREYLAPRFETEKDGKQPMWQCFGTCENLIRQLPLLQYDKCNCEDAADGNDHAPEALRYGLMSRPRRSQQPIVKKARAYDPLSVPERASGWL